MDDRTTYPASRTTYPEGTIPEPAYTRPIDAAPAPAAATTTRVGEPIPERRPVVGAATEPPVNARRFSMGATFLGWGVASFFSLLFFAIAGAFLGGNAILQYYQGGTSLDVDAYGIAALVGILVATFLAFTIGGYAAGRISLWDGVKHGALIVVWPVLFGILGIIVGTALGDDFVAATGINFGTYAIDEYTGGAIVGLVATLIAMIAGGALGGRLGERYHERVYGAERRRASARGRTF